MIVQGRHVDSVVEEGGHHGIYLILKQHQVAHHHFVAIRCRCERNPSAELERSWCRYPLHAHLEIGAGNIDLHHSVFPHRMRMTNAAYGVLATADVGTKRVGSISPTGQRSSPNIPELKRPSELSTSSSTGMVRVCTSTE